MAMDRNKVLSALHQKTECSPELCERIWVALADLIVNELKVGETVDLNPELGKFIPKLHDNMGRDPNSPRTLKKPFYRVHFSPSGPVKQRLKAEIGTTECKDAEKKDFFIVFPT